MLKAHKIFKQKVLIFHFADNLSVHKINIFFWKKVEIPRKILSIVVSSLQKQGDNMCSVGDSFGVELETDMEPHDYVCNQCGKKFKGIGTNLRCPKCHSTDNKRIE